MNTGNLCLREICVVAVSTSRFPPSFNAAFVEVFNSRYRLAQFCPKLFPVSLNQTPSLSLLVGSERDNGFAKTERAWSFPESVLHNHRHRLLYEAAQSMLRSKKWSWLKAWAMLCA
jgi:hypothetical protein